MRLSPAAFVNCKDESPFLHVISDVIQMHTPSARILQYSNVQYLQPILPQDQCVHLFDVIFNLRESLTLSTGARISGIFD